MESLLAGSFPKLTITSYSFPAAANLSSSLASGRLGCIPRATGTSLMLGINGFENHKWSSVHQIRGLKGQPYAGSIDPPESIEVENADRPMKSLQHAYDVFYRFLRPYAAMGTVVSIISYSLLAAKKISDFSPLFVMKTLEAVAAAFLMQIYVGGYNQITDIEIDKVNKPYLPLASGELAYGAGVALVASSALMSFSIAWKTGSWPLFWALFSWFALGTAYSIDLPLLRWKKYPLMAALYIVAERGLVVPTAFYVHAQTYIQGSPAVLSSRRIFTTSMMILFSFVIAYFKDIPDIEGDQKHGIKSLAARIGPKRMFWSCIWFLEMAYGFAILMGLSSSSTWSKYAMVLGHALMASVLWIYANSVDLKSKAAIQKCYTFIWKLFYMEFLLMPLMR